MSKRQIILSEIYINNIMDTNKIIKYHSNYRNLGELLEDKYEFILNEIKTEGYNLSYNDFEIFKEIIFEDRVVGFYTYEKFKQTSDRFLITELYILPEFRGNNIASGLVWNWITDPNYIYYFRKPSRAFIDLLIKNNLARKFDNLVVSEVKFSVNIEEIYINSKIKNDFKKIGNKKGMSFIANLYDYNLCSTVIVESSGWYSKIKGQFCISTSRLYDTLKYRLRNMFKKVDSAYLENLLSTYLRHELEIDAFHMNCEVLIEERNSIESEESFNNAFLDIIKENGLDSMDADRIYKHVMKALENDEITSKSARLRINFLIHNMDKIDRVCEDEILFDECPFCYHKINDDLTVCENCGCKINDEKEISHTNMPSFLNILKSFKKARNKRKIDKNDKEYDIKVFYKDYLEDYNFHEFRDFYYAYDGEEIEKICDDFLECKLNENLNINPYEAYKTFLINNMYFKKDYDLKECMIYLIKFTILVSNDYNYDYPDKNANIIENSRSSIDIFYFMSEYLPDKIDFDINECLDTAFVRFRLDEYKNNEEEIIREFPKYFSDT